MLLFAKGPTLDTWLADYAAGRVTVPVGSILATVNDVCLALPVALLATCSLYIFAADRTDLYAERLPVEATLVCTQEAADNSRITPPCARRVIVPNDYFPGSVILAARWLRENLGVRRLTCVGLDGGFQRSRAVDWPAGTSLVPGSYTVIRGKFISWCWSNRMAVEFYGLQPSEYPDCGLSAVRFIKDVSVRGVHYNPGSVAAFPHELAIPLIGERRAVADPTPAWLLMEANT